MTSGRFARASVRREGGVGGEPASHEAPFRLVDEEASVASPELAPGDLDLEPFTLEERDEHSVARELGIERPGEQDAEAHAPSTASRLRQDGGRFPQHLDLAEGGSRLRPALPCPGGHSLDAVRERDARARRRPAAPSRATHTRPSTSLRASRCRMSGSTSNAAATSSASSPTVVGSSAPTLKTSQRLAGTSTHPAISGATSSMCENARCLRCRRRRSSSARPASPGS